MRRSLSPGIPARRAFSLVELLTCIVIVGVLAALVSVGLSKATVKADEVRALSNLRVVGSGIFLYAADNNGYAPAVYDKDQANKAWLFVLVENGYLEDPIALPKGNGKWTEGRELVNLYNPITRKANPDVYNSGGYGMNAFQGLFSRRKLAGFPNPSLVVLAADANFTNGWYDWALSGTAAWQLFPSTINQGGANYLFADGHVQWVKALAPLAANSAPEGFATDIQFVPK